MALQQLKTLSKNDLILLEQLHKSHLLKIKESNFDINEFLVYQDALSDYIMKFYDDNNFQKYRINPQQFIKTKTNNEIVNALFAKHCFNLIDLLAMYINAIDKIKLTYPIALANIIIMELVWGHQTLTQELEKYL